MLRVLGDPELSCHRIAILPGSGGRTLQIGMLASQKPDLLICGEIDEWETNVYVSDANWSYSGLALYHGTSVAVTSVPIAAAYRDWVDDLWEDAAPAR